MGTRNLTAVMVDGEYKVAQYGQFDGYPSGQGLTALEFLRSSNIDAFRTKVRMCSWVTEEQLKQMWVACGADPDSDMVSLDVADRFDSLHPHLSRRTAARVLAMIDASPSGLVLNNSIGFAADSLFCEWAYVIDLDKRTFEVYRGFNQTPIATGERFGAIEADGQYYPVRHVVTYSLDALPSRDEFEAACEW